MELVFGTILAVDAETSGLREKDRPFGLSVANTDTAKWFDFRTTPKEIIDAQIEILNKAEILIFQNAKFDLRMLSHVGLRPKGQVADIAVLGRLVRNDHLSYSLADAAKRLGLEKLDIAKNYLEEHKLYSKIDGDKVLHFDRIPPEIIAEYAAHDARITYDIYHKLLPQLDQRSVPVWEMEKALTPVLYRMERAGILIDKAYTTRAMNHEQGLIREAMNHFHVSTGHIYDNKKSTLVKVFTDAGEIIPKTEKGNDQLTDDVLESFKSPVAKIVQKIRTSEKKISTYYNNFIKYMDDQNVIHPDIKQSGTTTGRFSCINPNLQNLPAEEESEDEFIVRKCFIPRPGYVFVSIDYSQIEYRVMLAYAKHWKLIQDVMGGVDVHQAIADMVGIKRKEAKTLNFACLYGAGVDKIAWMLGIPDYKGMDLKNKYFSRIREIQVLIWEITHVGKVRGQVYTWLGRKLFVNRPEFAYKLPNHLIQGGSADVCKTAMVAVDNYIKDFDCYMLLQVHDELIFEMREYDMPTLVPEIKRLMEAAWPEKNGMRLEASVSWSRKSLAKRDMEEWK